MKTIILIILITSAVALVSAQDKKISPTRVVMINSLAFSDEKSGIKKLIKANDLMGRIDCAAKFQYQDLKIEIQKLEKEIAELLVTQYPLGAVINWHRDAPPFKQIAGISLLSDCIFRLRPYDKLKQNRNSILSFPVKRRSLYVMEGIARQDWEHSIAPVMAPRWSITLRSLRGVAGKRRD